jgi:hypothetical protein
MWSSENAYGGPRCRPNKPLKSVVFVDARDIDGGGVAGPDAGDVRVLGGCWKSHMDCMNGNVKVVNAMIRTKVEPR